MVSNFNANSEVAKSLFMREVLKKNNNKKNKVKIIHIYTQAI